MNLVVYGISHAIVDAACVALIFSLLVSNAINIEYFVALAIIYNVLAFGTQPIFGLITDKIKNPKFSAISGSLLTALAILIAFLSPLAATIIAGIANALFHIGGGTISLNLTKNKATAPAIFVAPGALGLLIGTFIGGSRNFIAWPFIIVLIFMSMAMYFTKHPKINYRQDEKINVKYFELIILLLFFVVAIRSLIGSVVALPWKTDLLLLFVFTMGVVLGKALGGILGDKYGWTKVSVISLVVSAPLLAFGAMNPYLAIFGMFLFNFTMPITLVAISNTLPGRPGFSFGLTTLALIVGFLLTYTDLKTQLSTNLAIFVIILISTVLLFYALKLYDSKIKLPKNKIISRGK